MTNKNPTINSNYHSAIARLRYHLRSNVESTFSALKRKFGDYVRSKKLHSIKNEILAKIVCYNAAVLSEALIEYNLEAGFLRTGGQARIPLNSG